MYTLEEDLLNIDKAPSRSELKEAFLKATRNPVVVEGKVDGQSVDQVYLDPGASKTLIKQEWVDKAKLTGR